ncbi:MAG: membrane dipeptidase [Rikenellaceae bacterium]
MIYNFEKGFNDNESLGFAPRPIIAISANIIDENSALHFAYSQAIIDAGAVPVIVPATCDEQALCALMRGVDGLLLSGGADIDARYFGEENVPNLTDLNLTRDYYELALLRAAIDYNLPILGICRGCQLINIALGGSIYQDLESMYPQKPLEHSVLHPREKGVHSIAIDESSMLHKIVGKKVLDVNSRHHQAIKHVAPSLRVSARSQDGVIEAIEGYPTHKIIALQCHPENLATTAQSPEMIKLFAFFACEAELYRKAKNIHLTNPIVDSHCDTPMLYESGKFNFSIRNSSSQVDLIKMQQGYLDSTITVAYISQQTPKEVAVTKAFSILKRFAEDIEKLKPNVEIARSAEDVARAKARGAKSILLGVENGLAIGDDIENIDRCKELGVSYITLCHNGANDICDSAIGDELYGGVSPFGAAVIQRMNALGITVDISHSSHKSTMQALALSSQPIIASHSSAKALCHHPRNLSDEAIVAIAAKGGVIQTCAYAEFVREDVPATIHDYIAHIEHIISLVGVDHVGVGSDFDGGGGVAGFNAANDFINVTIELLRAGHTAEDIAKIMGGNILRVLSDNQKIHD